MRVIKLQAENFKKIKVVDITPKDNMVVISGKNGQGKTSVLDSMFAALCGKDSALIKPIREGELQSNVMVELDKYIVTRTFKQGSTKLEVVAKESGEIMPKPQNLLDSIIGSLAFDPLEFANKNAKDQRAILLQLANLDLDSFEAKYKSIYQNRHETGLDLKAFPTYTAQEIQEARICVLAGRVDQALLLAELEKSRADTIAFENIGLSIKNYQGAIDRNRDAIVEMHQKIGVLEDQINEWNKTIEAWRATPIPTSKDPQQLTLQIQNSSTHNEQVYRAETLLKSEAEKAKVQQFYDLFTRDLEALATEKDKVLRAAKMPIDGLSVTPDSVVFNQIPFQQLSGAEKLKVSMAIAMAMNPELRVIRIVDGSLLDEDNMKVLREMAANQDFQVWIERVDSTGKVGFYLEEGEIKAVNE